MELELGLGLGLAPPNPHPPRAPAGDDDAGLFSGAKRAFGAALGPAEKTTLPLFVREDGEDGRRGGRDDRETSTKRKRLVGWPPVKCAHRRGCGGGGGGYVKVMMQGVAIGRKVDVSLHGSYDELLRTLRRMFPPSSSTKAAAARADAEEEEEDDGEVTQHYERHVVTYEDGEGDWLLVGDVPWEAFAKSVKRLKIQAAAA